MIRGTTGFRAGSAGPVGHGPPAGHTPPTMKTPHPHPGNPHDTSWQPPHDQDIVTVVTIPQENGEIVIKEPGEPAWLRTADWYSLSRCR